MPTETLYTVREAAKKIMVSPALIYALLAARKIRHERHGLKRGKILIPESALEEYRRRRTVEISESESPPPALPPLKLKHLSL